MRIRWVRLPLTLAAFAAAVACSADPPPEPPPDAGPCGTVISAPLKVRGSMSGGPAVLYAEDGDLSLYSVPSDSVSLLKNDLTRGNSVRLEFLDARSVTFSDEREADEKNVFGRSSLYRLDVASRQVTEVLRLATDILAYGWSPDRSQLAFEIRTFTTQLEEGREIEITTSALCLYDTAVGSTKLIRPLGILPGRGGSESDERSIRWSPNGRMILLLDTFQEPSIYVLDGAGRDAVTPRSGTFARWLDDDTVLFREQNRFRADGGKRRGRWFTLDLTTAKAVPIGLPSGMSRPELSPDRRRIALDDADTEEPATYVYELATGASRLLVRGYGAPIWFSDREVAVTAGGPCPPRTECNDRWTPLGRTIAVDVRSGARRSLKLPTTGPFSEDVAVLLP